VYVCTRTRVYTHTHTHTHTHSRMLWLLHVSLVFSYFLVKHEKRGHARVSQFCLSYCHLGVIMWLVYANIMVTTRICSTPRASDLVCTKIYHYPQLSLSTLTWFTRIGNLRDDCRYTSKEERWKRKTLLAREYEKLAIKIYSRLGMIYI